MILADPNLQLYAYDEDAPEHERARRWLEGSLSAASPFALAWQTVTAFIRMSANVKAFPAPLTVKEAAEVVTEWPGRPNVTVLRPTEKHWEVFSRLPDGRQAAGALAMDAHLTALAIGHGAALATTGRDFSRLTGLRTLNPLARSR